MNVNDLKKSNFLQKGDVGNGVLVTVRDVTEENIAKDGAPPEMKWCLHLEEMEKPMVLNLTNGQLIAQITKSDASADWPGTKLVLYNEPSVTYGGKVTGGIRVRAPRVQAAKPATVMGRPVAGQAMAKAQPITAEPAQSPIEDDDCPY